MNNEITKLLQGVKDGSISVDDALLKIKKQPFEDIGFAKIDLHRKARQGAAEVIYGKGKTAAQIIQIVKTMQAAGQNIILITRLDQEKAIEIQKEVGGNCKVILCATHDTGSAFEAVDVDEDTVILSSGTWSLLGIKTKDPIISETSLKRNYTNEGGVNYIRFLKNVMGMWISNQLKTEVCYTQGYVDLNIYLSNYKVTFDVNDSSLIAPKSMKNALMNLLEKCPPQNDIELFSSIYRSMAVGYKEAIDELEEITNRKFNKILIVGGGAKNKFLNEQVKYYTKRHVIALPIEATAMGNLKIQMKVSKEL